MDLLQNIQNIFGVDFGDSGNSRTQLTAQQDSSLSQLFTPAVLGGLAGALFSGKGRSGLLKGALLAGGGAYLWNKYKDRMKQANIDNPQYVQRGSDPQDRASRIIRALVYAARSDGHVDEQERAAINEQVGGTA